MRENAPRSADDSDVDRVDRARLRWRCRRGMRELDAVLAGFVDSEFTALDPADRERLTAILDLPDPELHSYLVGGLTPEDPAFASLFRRIREAFVPPD
jgi:antitoxin CptB